VSHHGERPAALVGATVVCVLVLGVGAGLALGALAAWGPAAYRGLWLLGLSAPLLLLAPNLAGLWLGEGRMAPMARLQVAPQALALALALVLLSLLFGPPALAAVLVAWVSAKAVVGLGALGVLWRGGRLVAPDFAGLRREGRFIATIGLSNLIALLNYRVGLFVIERQWGLAATGVYSIAVVVAELLWFVSGSLTQAVYGRIGVPDRAQAAATTLRALHLGVAALLLVAPLLWLVAWALLPRVLGPDYRASLLPLALLLPGALLFGGASALSAFFTNHLGRPRVPAQVAAVSLAINAGSCVLLVPWLGTAGAALAASVAYAVSVGWLAWRFARHAGLPLARVLWPGAQLGADLRAAVAWRRKKANR
jgi:O-antigen/teichoic acid export membrane protein